MEGFRGMEWRDEGRNQSLEKEKGSQRWSEIWIWSARYSYG
jgi:hypothetical protein